MTILIIEDDITLSRGIVLALKSDSCQFTQCHTLCDAKAYCAAHVFDLVILDINLPDGNGLEFLVELRREAEVPVILLTANDMENDIVTGLELGANDYITKPFSLAVLRARVNTQLRARGIMSSAPLSMGEFLFDFDKMEFWRAGKPVELSRTEQKLLRILIDNRGITLRREELIDRIWTDGADYVDENALSVTIKRLRGKLDDVPARYIKTVYGLGYTWVVV